MSIHVNETPGSVAHTVDTQDQVVITEERPNGRVTESPNVTRFVTQAQFDSYGTPDERVTLLRRSLGTERAPLAPVSSQVTALLARARQSYEQRHPQPVRRTSPEAIVRPFGGMTESGLDNQSADGNMTGDVVGDTFGYGGLGVAGTGWGGYAPETRIGMGSVGPLEYGAGTFSNYGTETEVVEGLRNRGTTDSRQETLRMPTPPPSRPAHSPASSPAHHPVPRPVRRAVMPTHVPVEIAPGVSVTPPVSTNEVNVCR